MNNVNKQKLTWWAAHKPTTRRLVQLYAALLYNANLKGFFDGHIYSGALKSVCVPGLNCYSCPGAVGSCPLGALQNALNASGHTAPWYILGILALFGITLGRTICGWLCPVGLIQELLHKIPTLKIRKNRITRFLAHLKYAVLAVFVIAIPIWYGLKQEIPFPAFCKYICPAGTLEGAVGLLQNPANSSSFFQLKLLFTRKWVIMLLIGLASVFCYRSFCRFLCPLGAIYSIFNRFALIGVKVDTDLCDGCGACIRSCQMDVRHVGDRECISCGKCIKGCPQNAIFMQAGKPEETAPVILKQKGRGTTVRVVAFAVLAAVLIRFNLVQPHEDSSGVLPEYSAEQPADYTSDRPIGTETGNVLPDFSTELLSGEYFHLADYRGRVVIINLWGTTCAPCIEEMPYFEALKVAHPEIEILAIHNLVGAKKAEAFLADKGWDHLDFALDSKEKGIYKLINAADAMPQTIVLNKKGEIIYNVQAPVTYEQLEELYVEAG